LGLERGWEKGMRKMGMELSGTGKLGGKSRAKFEIIV